MNNLEESKTIKTKKPANNTKLLAGKNGPGQYIERRCKIIDAVIMDVNDSNIQTIFVVLNDIVNKSVQLTMNIAQQDMVTLGFPISSKDLIDIAAWLKYYNETVIVNVPENERSITLQMLLDSIDEDITETTEDEFVSIAEEIIELASEPVKEEKNAFTRTVKAAKFGRRRK